jgi:cytochrome P450
LTRTAEEKLNILNHLTCAGLPYARWRAIWRRLLRVARISGQTPDAPTRQRARGRLRRRRKADLVEQFTEPFILRSVCTLVGLPEGDHVHVAAADMLTELTGLVDDPQEPFDAADALMPVRSRSSGWL